jgi:hypothetical protein
VLLTILLLCSRAAGQGTAAPLLGPAEDRPINLVLRRAFTLGGADDTALVLSQLFPQDVGTDARNRLFILNRTDFYVARYSSAGRLESKLGRNGAGPGEFTLTSGMAVTPAGGIWIIDAAKRALVGFDSAGRVLPEVSLRGRGAQRIAALTDGTLLFSNERRDTAYLRRIQGDSSLVLAAVPLAPTRSVNAAVCGLVGYQRRPVFSPDLLWAARGSRLVYASGPGYSFTLLQGSGPARTFRRSRKPTPATLALGKRALGPGGSMQVAGRPPCVIPADSILRGAGVAAAIPAYSSLLLESRGRIWALRWSFPDGPQLADIYSAERGYLGTVNLGTAKPVGLLEDGRLIALERDANDVPVVVVYTVQWPAGAGFPP